MGKIIYLIVLFLIYSSYESHLKVIEDIEQDIEVPYFNFMENKQKLSLDSILKPKAVAVIGASSKLHSIGYEILARLKEMNYKGKIFPVNPKGGEFFGIKAYKKVTEIPEPVDMAIIVVKAQFVLNSIDECNQKGIKGLVIITAGFKEVDHEGAVMEEQMLEKVKKYGMRLVGPNCLGVINTHPNVSLDATFALKVPVRGNIGFVSQSGALVAGILNILRDLQIGFSQLISVGNQPDVNAETAIEYWENDEDVKQILLYLETIKDAKNFRQLASRITKKKPILALKAGSSPAGASAASSHTGSLAGADMAADTLLRQCGVIREINLREIFLTAKVFSTLNVPKGNRVAIVSNAGGPGIMATDAAYRYGLSMAKFEDKTRETIKSYLPKAASVKNPIDMIASASLQNFKDTLRYVLEDKNVDMVMTFYTPVLGMTDMELAQAFMEIKAKYDKPVVSVFMSENSFFRELSNIETNMPFFQFTEDAMKALSRLYQQRVWMDKPVGKTIQFCDVHKEEAEKIFKAALKENRDQLTTKESIEVLSLFNIRTTKSGFAENEETAVSVANKIGYPVVMKMTSKKTSHKTDVGGVVLNIKSEEQLRKEYNALIERLKAKNLLDGLEGVIIQEMVQGNRELACGIATDVQYGHMLMVGLGGVWVEVLKDVTFRILPITDVDSQDMLKEVKSYKMLQGARGTKVANFKQIEETLQRLSYLSETFDFIDELDINPLLISESTGEGVAVDGRIKINVEKAKKILNC
ncbi:MAG: acetate--CoA ligase family protein [archaeon]|nr:acetate--CoA ligase family protein [archaeon]